ncbi:MAG: glycosyltransferase family 39 protein [Nitrososphaerota archaeon]
MDKKDLLTLLILIATSYALMFLIPPMDFPLSDDYVYYSEVRTFLEEGKIKMYPSTMATSVVQIMIGSIPSLILGLSHKTLMLTTMLIGVVPIIFTYLWLRLWSSRLLSFLGSMLLLLNPVYYYHSHTFMTDVYSISFMLPSLYFLYTGVVKRSDKRVAIGVILSLFGFWVRQYAILIIGGPILWYVYRLFKDKKNEFTPIRIFILIIVPVVNVLIWWTLFPMLHDLEHMCLYVVGIGGWVPKNMLQLVLFSGYFIFPLGIVYILSIKRFVEEFNGLSKYFKMFLILLLIALIAFMILRTVYGLGNKWVPAMPFAYATANPKSIGPTPIAGYKDYLFPLELWWPISILSVVAAFGTLVAGLKRLNEEKFVLLFAFMVSSMLPQTFYGNFFDRYYMLMIPLMLPIIFNFIRNQRILIPCLILTNFVLGLWSYYGVYDHFSWNSARWEGINYLLNTGVPEQEIDGGLEYNARFFQGCQNINVTPVRWYGWGYSIIDNYIISLNSPLDGYDILKEIPYYNVFGTKVGSVFVLKKST